MRSKCHRPFGFERTRPDPVFQQPADIDVAQSTCPDARRSFPLQPHSACSWPPGLALALILAILLPGIAAAHASPWPEGTIAALWVPPGLLDVIDPGGHSVDPGGIRCSSCLTAFVSNGYCRLSRIGYVDGRAYVSRLSYLLASAGEHIYPPTLSCSTCRAHMQTPGWCDRCGRGVVGTVAVRNRQDFNEILMEWQRLEEAIRISSRCDLCAIAYFTHGRCSRCRIAYNNAPVSTASIR